MHETIYSLFRPERKEEGEKEQSAEQRLLGLKRWREAENSQNSERIHLASK
jgi:hypothetical protein